MRFRHAVLLAALAIDPVCAVIMCFVLINLLPLCRQPKVVFFVTYVMVKYDTKVIGLRRQ
jgi:hypothetical protein